MNARKAALWGALAGMPLCATAAVMDGIRHPAEAAIMGACVLTNAGIARQMHLIRPKPQRHRPDYALIRLLEAELEVGDFRPPPAEAEGAADKKIAELEQQVPEPKPLLRPPPRGPYYLPDLPGASAHEKYMNRIGRNPPPPDQ